MVAPQWPERHIGSGRGGAAGVGRMMSSPGRMVRPEDYRILQRLGSGGMGHVELAFDKRLERKVALKFLSDDLSRNETARRRFVREARMAAAIDHPYVCRVLDVGEAEGRAFIVMEYVEGVTLRDRLAEGRLPVARALEVALEVAEALGRAHELGIVHRDLKPGNVMLTRDGHVRVLDFGLAKRLLDEPPESEAPTQSAVTRAGTTLGTLDYMSPEQARGEPADRRSDVFSFGVLLYELLSGRHPFRRGTSSETLVAVLTEEPADLEPRGVPADLSRLVQRMLAKAPVERPSDMGEVREVLRHAGSSGAGGVPAWPRPWLRKTIGLVLAGVGALAILVVGLSLRNHIVPERAPNLTELEVSEIQARARYLMENFGDPESLRLSIGEWEKSAARRPAGALAGTALARVLIAWNTRADPAVLDRSEREAKEALESDPEDPLAYTALSMVYTLRGMRSTAEAMSLRSVELGRHDPLVLGIRCRLLIDLDGRFEEAAALAREAIEEHAASAGAWFQLGSARLQLEQWDEADAAFERALETRPDFVAGYYGRGMVRLATGRDEQALSAVRAGLKLDPDSVQGLFYEGLALDGLGRHEEALGRFEKVERINPDHTIVAVALLEQAVELDRLGRARARDAALATAERRFKARSGGKFAFQGLAGVASVRGERDVAFSWLRRAVEAGMRSTFELKVDPAFAPIRDDPRFAEIARRMRDERPQPATPLPSVP
jgi:tetratricopeptide (TPR) repeat protein/predicted Ser/Thr protein kinase